MKKAELVKNMVRSIFAAPDGKSFFCADFASIEARIVLWLAVEESALETLRSGRDIYVEMAKEINPTEPDRQLGKQIILGAGFGMGPKVFSETCQGYGMDVDFSLAERAIGAYRSTYPGVQALWKEVGEAFQKAMNGDNAEVRGMLFRREAVAARNVVSVYLYSGRKIIYWEPQMSQGRYGAEITCLLKLQGGAMGKRRTWGGDIFQDIVQGTARDLMCLGARSAQAQGFDIVMTVHDEALALGDEDRDINDYIKAFSVTPDWAAGLPVESSGWKGRYYRKD